MRKSHFTVFLVVCLCAIFIGCQGRRSGPIPEKNKESKENDTIESTAPVGNISRIDDWVLRDWGMEELTSLRQIADKLTPEQRSHVEDIRIEECQKIQSLDGIEEFPNLIILDLGQSQLASLSGLEKSGKLRSLYIIGPRIQNLSGIENAPNLWTLGIIQSPIIDIGDLSQLSELKGLSLHGTNILHLDGEKLPKSLIYLGLRETKLTSLTAIESTFGFVEKIDLTASSIEGIDDVKNFGVVKAIGLYMTPVMEKFRDSQGNVPQYVDYKGVRLIFVEPEF